MESRIGNSVLRWLLQNARRDRREVLQRATAVVLAQETGGVFLEFEPAGNVRFGSATDMAEQAEPFDKGRGQGGRFCGVMRHHPADR